VGETKKRGQARMPLKKRLRCLMRTDCEKPCQNKKLIIISVSGVFQDSKLAEIA